GVPASFAFPHPSGGLAWHAESRASAATWHGRLARVEQGSNLRSRARALRVPERGRVRDRVRSTPHAPRFQATAGLLAGARFPSPCGPPRGPVPAGREKLKKNQGNDK